MSKALTKSKALKLSSRELVVACLYHSPDVRVEVSALVDRRARFLCDGFGNLSERDLDPTDSYPLYDWSHVRDSSDEAIEVCACFLRSQL
jgi:hypothetical protein